MEIDWFLILNYLIYFSGIVLALSALFQSRTPQGATAWFLGLVGFPFIAIPLYIAFGRRRFSELRPLPLNHQMLWPFFIETQLESKTSSKENLFIESEIKLLIDGHEIYSSMLSDIANAKSYIILQVYIFRTDETGKMFAEALRKKSLEGVKVYLLYEKVLIRMSQDVLNEMKKAGVKLGNFKPFQRNKWHLNFRNHRKILIIDGTAGFFGGLNIGDDYVGKYPRLGHWRDTNVRITGSSLLSAIEAFEHDWYSSQGFKCDLPLFPALENKRRNFIFATGPIDEKPFCLLHHIALINLAKKRLWIANPYIVPPQSLMDALSMAALRGVDVRILVPNKTDNPFIGAVDEIYYERLMEYGVKIFRYNAGFLHQKVMLIDSKIGVVGSANLDFRSMYINFEVTTISIDEGFIKSMQTMLLKDFLCSREIFMKDITSKNWLTKVYQRGVNLLAPVL